MHIEPEADAALQRMSTALAHAQSFAFQAATTFDEPLAAGQLAQVSRKTRVTVHRPDRVFAEIHEGNDVSMLWYAGTDLTIYDTADNVFSAIRVPAQIDAMLDDVVKRYDLTIPLADLLFSDPYKILTSNIVTGKFIGVHKVNGTSCKHLLFTQENVDWQIWIDADTEPLPRKVVIDYKNLPGRPQFVAVLSNWNLHAQTGNEQFTPALPSNAKRIDMADLLETRHQTK